MFIYLRLDIKIRCSFIEIKDEIIKPIEAVLGENTVSLLISNESLKNSEEKEFDDISFDIKIANLDSIAILRSVLESTGLLGKSMLRFRD